MSCRLPRCSAPLGFRAAEPRGVRVQYVLDGVTRSEPVIVVVRRSTKYSKVLIECIDETGFLDTITSPTYVYEKKKSHQVTVYDKNKRPTYRQDSGHHQGSSACPS